MEEGSAEAPPLLQKPLRKKPCVWGGGELPEVPEVPEVPMGGSARALPCVIVKVWGSSNLCPMINKI